jgi:plastocyanin
MKFWAGVGLSLFASLTGIASDVQGDIKLDPRMAKKKVPPAVYDLRGMAPAEKRQTPKDISKFSHVAVWLEADRSGAAPVTATMRQYNLRFDPDFLIVPVGSTVVFPNMDPLFHNIFSLSPAEPFDLGYYEKGKSREVLFSRPGIVQIYCHVHPEMYGVVVVTRSSWTAIPADDGSFSFSGVPAGVYKVMVWQRAAGLVSKSISVPSTGAVHIGFSLPTDDKDQ